MPLARRALVDFAARAGADGERLEAIRLAVSEAVTNVVIHAYRKTPGMIAVNAAVAGGELTVLIADSGCGPQVPACRPGLGMGWALIADACEVFSVTERSDGGTEAELRFNLAA